MEKTNTWIPLAVLALAAWLGPDTGPARAANVEPAPRLAQEAPAPPRVISPAIRALAVTVVPELYGRTVPEARDLLEKAGLQVGEISPVPARQAPGTVVRQQPGARETTTRGARVNIWVSEAPKVRVPDLYSRMARDAEAILARSRLRLGEVTTEPADADEGTIVRQSPPRGQAVDAGTPVSIWVAARRPPEPPREFAVPGVVGQPLRDAAIVLRRAGFRMVEAGSEESDQAEGSVSRQEPDKGTRAPRGTAVRVWVATVPMASVPDLRGIPVEAAGRRLRDARLRLGAQTAQPSLPPAGEVITQKPLPGERLRADSAVDVVVGDGSRAQVPGLVGRRADAARDFLERAALRPGRVTTEESARPEGEVLRQRPDEGRLVARGSEVDYWVAVPQKVAVPRIIGRSAAEAMAELTRLDLTGEQAGAEESSRPEGEVLRQEPVQGARVARGSRVEFWVAAPVLVTVPDLSGMPGRLAAERVRAEGLAVGQAEPEESREPEGSVVRQDPPRGIRVPRNTRVNVWFATPVQVAVPSLVGLHAEEARARLSGLELVMAPRPPDKHDAPEGTILAQEPPPGTRVRPGAEVTVRVSAGPTPVWPWVAGGAAALALLGGAGWTWARRPKPAPSPPSARPELRVRLDQPLAEAPDGLPLDPKAPEVGIRTRLVAGESSVAADQLVVDEEREKT
ncbi:MAG TPA: PASTA domain-containing protein [Burkholderiales bacterium]|nr:PASTA domain-containing protein [Burkholderiales bacterium]